MSGFPADQKGRELIHGHIFLLCQPRRPVLNTSPPIRGRGCIGNIVGLPVAATRSEQSWGQASTSSRSLWDDVFIQGGLAHDRNSTARTPAGHSRAGKQLEGIPDVCLGSVVVASTLEGLTRLPEEKAPVFSWVQKPFRLPLASGYRDGVKLNRTK